MKPFPVVALVLTLAGFARAATVWTGGEDGVSWSHNGNWNPGTAPTGATAVEFGIDPAFNVIGIENSSAAASLLFNNTLTESITFLGSGSPSDSLTINGAITNASSSEQIFQPKVIAGADATYAGGSGGLTFTNLDIGTRHILTTGSVSIDSSIGNLVLTINSSSSFGTINLIDVTGASISVNGSYTGVFGNTFQFTTGSFSGASIGTLPVLNGGLSWDTSHFLDQGRLTVVPEPATWGLLGVALLLLAYSRSSRRCQARVSVARVRHRR